VATASRRRTPDPRPDPPRGGLRLVTGEAYASWESIYRDNVDRLYRLMFAKVGNAADAEDLTAEVFLSAVPRVRTGAHVGQVRAYLLAVARTVLADHWRRTLGRPLTMIDPDEFAEVFTAPDPGAVPADRVRRILDELPDRYRTILELRFLQGCTIREAAGRMGVTVANAKVLQYRALRHAARLVDPEEGGAHA